MTQNLYFYKLKISKIFFLFFLILDLEGLFVQNKADAKILMLGHL